MRLRARLGVACAVMLAVVATSACTTTATEECPSGARCPPPHECDAGDERACIAYGCPMFVDACNYVSADVPGVQQCQNGAWNAGCVCPFDFPPGYPLGCACTVEGESSCAGAQCEAGTWIASGPCLPDGCITPCVLGADAGT